ncbi:MAG: hypothetical protein HC788_05765 [Sphingopyxis sp.]|nr:hypothetical protein [Sphingopyxis sp.]
MLWKNLSTDNELYQLIVEQMPSTPAGIRVNRLQNRADNTFITGIVDGVTAANSETFTYTDAGRLSGATSGAGSYGTRSWTYDTVFALPLSGKPLAGAPAQPPVPDRQWRGQHLHLSGEQQPADQCQARHHHHAGLPV